MTQERLEQIEKQMNEWILVLEDGMGPIESTIAIREMLDEIKRLRNMLKSIAAFDPGGWASRRARTALGG